MPLTIARACSTPRCPEINCRDHGHHTRAPRFHTDPRRGTSHERGYGSRWRKARASYLASHPLCVYAQRHGKVEAGVVVDHVRSHGGDQKLFWSHDNWQTLSTAAHNTKGMREKGMLPCSEHGQATATVLGQRVCRDCGRPA